MHLIIFMVEVWTISSFCVLFFLLWAWPYLFHHDRVCGFAVSEDCGGDVLLSLLHLSPNHNLTRPFNQLLDSTNKDNKTREYILITNNQVLVNICSYFLGISSFFVLIIIILSIVPKEYISSIIFKQKPIQVF